MSKPLTTIEEYLSRFDSAELGLVDGEFNFFAKIRHLYRAINSMLSMIFLQIPAISDLGGVRLRKEYSEIRFAEYFY